MESLFETFADFNKGIYELYENPHKLAAIWLNKPVLTDEGITLRIRKGHKINYADGYISATDNNFNKEILECYGTLINQFSLLVKDLKTGIEERIKL
jgi:hypothetical protein